MSDGIKGVPLIEADPDFSSKKRGQSNSSPEDEGADGFYDELEIAAEQVEEED